MIKRLLLTLMLSLLGGLAAGCLNPGPIRVLSFNIRTASADDDSNAWELRRGHVIEVIRAQHPDVLALQEALLAQVTELRTALPEYGFVGVGRDDGATAGEFVPLFYLRRRFSLVDDGHFWLSAQPERVGSVGWDAALPRIATWVRLRFKDAPLTDMQVVNVHFDHVGAQARVESARLIRQLSESLGGLPLIVLGDFNCPPGSPPYRMLTHEGRDLAALSDVHVSCAAAAAGTYHAFTGQPREGRIDWILVSRQFSALQADVDRTDFAGRYPSDHFPVVATLRLTRN